MHARLILPCLQLLQSSKVNEGIVRYHSEEVVVQVPNNMYFNGRVPCFRVCSAGKWEPAPAYNSVRLLSPSNRPLGRAVILLSYSCLYQTSPLRCEQLPDPRNFPPEQGPYYDTLASLSHAHGGFRPPEVTASFTSTLTTIRACSCQQTYRAIRLSVG